jgi:hypothetical protein
MKMSRILSLSWVIVNCVVRNMQELNNDINAFSKRFWFTNYTNYSSNSHSLCSCWLLILVSLY